MCYDTRPSFVVIPKCQFCGAQNCIAHKKYTDRCEECGYRYHRYASYKSQQRKKPTLKRQVLIDRIVEEYKVFKQLGFKVPRDIE